MKIKRMLPPAAAPLHLNDLWSGLIGLFSSGRPVERLEREIKAYLGVKHVFSVSSGKAALVLILRGLKAGSPKRQVILPAYTCFSVPAAVMKAGLDVVPCDIDQATFDFNYDLLEQTINEETLCVVSTHLFGVPSDLDRLRRLCGERGIYLVEDAAQAMGGNDRGKKLGTLGDVGFFSFGRGKNVTCGSGGMIVTNSDAVGERIWEQHAGLHAPAFGESLAAFLEIALMTFFVRPALYWFPAGLPFLKLGQTFFHREFPIERLSGMKAALLRNWKKRLERSNEARKETGAYFIEKLQLKLPGREKEPVPYLRLPVLMASREERERFQALLQEEGIGGGAMYPSPINEIEEIKELFAGRTFPAAKEVSERLLTLPTHPFVSKTDRTKICRLFAEAEPSVAASSELAVPLRFQCK